MKNGEVDRNCFIDVDCYDNGDKHADEYLFFLIDVDVDGLDKVEVGTEVDGDAEVHIDGIANLTSWLRLCDAMVTVTRRKRFQNLNL